MKEVQRLFCPLANKEKEKELNITFVSFCKKTLYESMLISKWSSQTVLPRRQVSLKLVGKTLISESAEEKEM